MVSVKPNPTRLEHIDMLRGLASFLVVGSHLRAFVFVNFDALKEPGWIVKGFYALTGIGHAAVIIFFAMSGFLVGGKALFDMRTGRWSWGRYLLRRSTRLLIVVAPALVATALLDRIGIGWTGNAGYDGSLYNLYSSGPSPSEPLNHSVWTFLGNLAFLQTICVPVFGSNGPMWSLANEFWYYIVFPLAATIVFVSREAIRRTAAIGVLLALICFLPLSLLEGGLIWATGAVAAGLARSAALAPVLRHNLVRVLALAPVLLTVTATRRPFDHGDLVFGLCVAFALPVLAWLPSFGAWYRASAMGVAEVSYTLYLTHFPLFTLLVLANLAPYRFQPSPEGVWVYLALMTTAVLWAVAFWWCFERNTDWVFGYLAKRLKLDGKPRRSVAATNANPC